MKNSTRNLIESQSILLAGKFASMIIFSITILLVRMLRYAYLYEITNLSKYLILTV